MDDKKRLHNAEDMDLPPLRLILDDIPSPDPEKRNKSIQQTPISTREKEGTVKRLIAYLEEDQLLNMERFYRHAFVVMHEVGRPRQDVLRDDGLHHPRATFQTRTLDE